tara:strand:- start:212 stop:2044 length:1833 start_codon:yes stop_codon:yes gene_type:complete
MSMTKDELLAEIQRLNRDLIVERNKIKKADYGLVWVDVEEAFEGDAENKLPILEEVKDKAITNNDGNPTHILIEGDNYHALTCLNYTHKGKIDLIYIDPPYNTGSDGFMYKDKRVLDKFPDGDYVPKDHAFRHSYWLSFMSKRLELARDLLSESGKIVISIDDNELANLILLCSKVFGSSNQVSILPTIMNLKGNQDEFAFAGTHEYTVVFAKNIDKCSFNQFRIEDEELESWDEDDIGFFKKGANIRATGEADKRADRPEMFYPILVKDNEAFSITSLEHSMLYNKELKKFNDSHLTNIIDKYEKNGFEVILPLSGDEYGRWRWAYSEKNKKRLKFDIIISHTKSGVSINKKQRPSLGDVPTKKPKSIFYKPVYSSGNGTNQLKNILPGNKFKAPKPVDLIKDLLSISSDKNSIVLDFFAGSATTLHACLELNNEGANIQNIICTNNEGNICQDVTYPRAEKVINGYKNLKGLEVAPLSNSLKYYKTSFVGNNSIPSVNDKDKTELAQKAGCLLSIAENTLDEVEHTSHFQFFKSNYRNTAIYFQEDLSELDAFVNKVEKLETPTTVYLFSWGNKSEFESMFDHIPNISIKTLPQPILEIYKKIYYINN